MAVEQGAGAIDYENGESISTENDMVTAGHLLAGHFGCAVLVKGGHGTHDASDVLVEPDGKITWFRSRRINNPNTHGTGCTLSSAIASHLALGEAAADGRRPCQSVPDRRFGSAARSWTWFRSDGPRVEVALNQATQNHANHGNRWNSTTSNRTKTHETTLRKVIMTLDRNAEKQEVPVNPETGKPYINTLAAVAISPAGASPEKSTYVAQAMT